MMEKETIDAIKTIVNSVVFIAAIVTGIVALIGHLINSGNAKMTAKIARANAELSASLEANVRLAEFRQKWIDALREDMAKFQSLATQPHTDPKLQREFYELGTRIELRMNPKDPNYNELQDAMYAYFSADNDDDKLFANTPYIEVCQSILKQEWDVLKEDLKKLDKPHDDRKKSNG